MDVRAEFIKFFESKGHQVHESSPLVPDDATLLFTNAGMVPFKTIFTGEIPAPSNPRAVDCQTCIRAGGKHNDLDNVGYTSRHHTFFEMLGNFSFGDYFKEDAISYAWEFVTEVLNFPKDKLWVTVHDSDNEAEIIWQKYIDKDRIKRFGDKDNFWQMGETGPCGPCSEIFIDQGSEHFNSKEDYLGGDGDRFLEIWNLVFMQYEKDSNGNLTPLPKPSIDTGMGLERVVAVKEGVRSNYDSSLFMPIIDEVSKLSNKTYVYETGASFRVISDHIRAVAFLLAQGVNFDKEGRGYVLRRILRRAVRHGYLLGLNEPFMYKLLDVLCLIMSYQYPYLVEKKDTIAKQIMLEEERFFKTIAKGIELFEKELENTDKTFSGDVAFKLYDTFGFPLDLTEDMLREKDIKIDIDKFETLMDKQKAKAKASWKGSGDKVAHGDFKELLEKFGINEFVGYDKTTTKSKIIALLDENYKHIDSLKSGKKGYVMLDKTPFYAQSGGQCGDIGTLDGDIKVLSTDKFFDINLSLVEASRDINVADEVEAKVDKSRLEIAKHHSATHLLHFALKKILGDHVLQAGSLVEKDRLRFDFSHPKALNQEEIRKIEDFVNSMIFANSVTDIKVMPIDEAKKSGAMALFGEKYGDLVRVVSLGDSIELCGGCHVDNTSAIGNFFIQKESGVSAGVRRIEAICGEASYRYAQEHRDLIGKIGLELKNQNPINGIKKLKDEISSLKKEIKDIANSSKKELNSHEINGVKIIIDTLDIGDIKEAIDDSKNRFEKVAIMLFQPKGDKVLIACGSKNTNIKAGAWIKQIAPILGGGGGGRDDFAQAGGKNVSNIDKAIDESMTYIKENIAK